MVGRRSEERKPKRDQKLYEVAYKLTGWWNNIKCLVNTWRRLIQIIYIRQYLGRAAIKQKTSS